MTPSRPASKAWPLIVLALSVLTLYFGRPLLIPIALAMTLTFILAPAVSWLERLRLGRTPAVLIVMVVVAGLAVFTSSVVVNQLLQLAEQLPNYSDNIRAKTAAIRNPVGGTMGRATQSIRQLMLEIGRPPVPEPAPTAPKQRRAPAQAATKGPADPVSPTPVQVVEEPNDGLANLRQFVVPLIAPIEMTGVVLIFTVFMLITREDLRNRLFRLVGVQQFNIVTQALDDGAQRISRYLVLQTLVNGLFGVLFGAGLYMIGVPAATLWGVLAGLARFVPYAGTAVAAIPPFLLSIAVFQGWHAPLLVFVLFATLELTVANAVEPWLYGSHMGISPLALLVTTTFWAMLWGWAGLILSTPLTVCLSVLGRYFPQLAFLHVLLGDEDALEPEAQFYQRLLAMDQDEARTIAERFLTEQSLVKLYDMVLIPAISLAEKDRHKGELDQAREAFVFLSVNELIAELADGQASDKPDEPVPLISQGRVICVPAGDAADAISASMLGQLLERAGVAAISLPLTSSPEALLAGLAPAAGDVVCICALPPFAFSQARTLCLSLHPMLKDCKILVGLWGHSSDMTRALERFGRVRPDLLAATLEEAVTQVIEWQRAPQPAPAVSGD